VNNLFLKYDLLTERKKKDEPSYIRETYFIKMDGSNEAIPTFEKHFTTNKSSLSICHGAHVC
jgi:hypothetical protein